MTASIGALLVREGHIDARRLRRALAREAVSGVPIDATVAARGWASEAALAGVIARATGFPAAREEEIAAAEEASPALLPAEVADAAGGACPIAEEGEILAVLVGPTADRAAAVRIARALERPIRPVVTTSARLARARERVYGVAPPAGLKAAVSALTGTPPAPSGPLPEAVVIRPEETPEPAAAAEAEARPPAGQTAEVPAAAEAPPEEDAAPADSGAPVPEAQRPTVEMAAVEAARPTGGAPDRAGDRSPPPASEPDAGLATVDDAPAAEASREAAAPAEARDAARQGAGAPAAAAPPPAEQAPERGPATAADEAAAVEAITGLTLAEAIVAMRNARTNDDLLLALVRGAHAHLPLAQVFAVQRGEIAGRYAIARGRLDRDAIRRKRQHLDDGSLVARVVASGEPHIGPIPAGDPIADLLGRATRRASGVAILPVTLKGRTVCVVVGAAGRRRTPEVIAAPLRELTKQASQALAELILRRKRRGGGPGRSSRQTGPGEAPPQGEGGDDTAALVEEAETSQGLLRAVEVLLGRIAAEDPAVRGPALRALKDLTGRRAREEVLEAIRREEVSADVRLRDAARAALEELRAN